MDWSDLNMSNVSVCAVDGSGSGAEADDVDASNSNTFVHPQQMEVVPIAGSEEDHVLPVEPAPRPDVVFKTLEGMYAVNDGVEVIGFVEEGQQLPPHILESMNQGGVGLSEEEILAHLQQQEEAQAQVQLEEQERKIEEKLLEADKKKEELAPPPEPATSDTSAGIVADEQKEELIIASGGGKATTTSGSSSTNEQVASAGSAASSVVITEMKLPQKVEVGERRHSGTTRPLSPVKAGKENVTLKRESQGGVTVVVVVSESAPTSTTKPTTVVARKQEAAAPGSPPRPVQVPTAKAQPKEPASSPPKMYIRIDRKQASSPQKPAPQQVALGSTEESKIKNAQPPSVGKEKGKEVASSSQSTMPPPSKTVVLERSGGEYVGIMRTSGGNVEAECVDEEGEGDNDDIIIEIPEGEVDYTLLNDVPEVEDDAVHVSTDEEDEGYRIQVENARTMLKVKQPVDHSAACYRPRFVSREKLNRVHPRCRGLTFRDIMHQTILEDKVLPDFNEQLIPRKVADKLRSSGHTLHRGADGGFMISSKRKNIKMYYSSFSARFEPVLADPVLENYVQEYRKTLQVSQWRRRLGGRKEMDPGSPGSSMMDEDADPLDEEQDDGELMQGSVAAWIIPDANVSRTPSPEPDLFDEPQFIALPATTDGPPSKKRKQRVHEPQPHTDGKIYPKPGFSYSCLIAMALKNSKVGSLPVSEIYKFMCDHFPFFKSAPSGWKNSVRHNLSLNKCFEKIEKPGNNGARKGCLWALNPAKIGKMDEEVQKWSRKDPLAITRAMSDPENLELIERGELKRDYSGVGASDDEEDEDYSEPATPLPSSQTRSSRANSVETSMEGISATIVTGVS